MSEQKITTCRGCGGVDLTPAFSMGIDNDWVICGDVPGNVGCGLLQRADDRSGTNYQLPAELSWTEQYRLRSVVTAALEMVSTRDGKVLDIGCGSGALLSSYPRWVTPVGIDPRLEESGALDWGIGIKAPFSDDESTATLREVSDDGFDIITAIGSLERENDPLDFLERVKSLLKRDGIAVIETTYAALALMRTLSSAFHREANAVYSLETLENLASDVGLRIIRGSMTEMNGGSIRVFLAHDDYHAHDYAPWFELLARLWDEEMALSLRGSQCVNAFRTRLEERRAEASDLRADMMRTDEYAYVIGTGPRVMASIKAVDLDYDVIAAHVGDKYRGGFPEVITEEMAQQTPPDVIFAPCWRRRETLETWHSAVMSGTRIVFMEPEFLVVDEHNYASELGRALAITDGPGSVDTLRAALSAMRGPSLNVVRLPVGA